MTLVTSNKPNGTPTWLDLGIPDLEQAKAFYGAVFGWDFVDYGEEAGHYHGCLLRGEAVAGLMQKDPEDTVSEYWWQVYFACDDVDGAIKRATDAGGTVLAPPDDVMEEGRMAILKDPSGAQFGLWQGRSHIGSRVVNEPGAPVWTELHTTESKRGAEFYKALFEYEIEEVPGGLDYTVLYRPDREQIGGVYGDPSLTASSWVTYFQVEDTDESVSRVREAGGTVVLEPEDTPYGRMAEVTDPVGTRFKVMVPSQAQ